MPNRRDFLRTVGCTALGTAFASSPAAAAWRRDTLGRIGIQLYTLRSLMQQDVERTLAQVAAIGYQEVEFAGYFDHAPADIRAMLQRAGLTAPGAHVAFPDLAEGWNGIMDAAETIGHQFVVTPGIPNNLRTADGYQRVAEIFNTAGELAQARGLRFGYHNHDFEFAPVAGRVPLDVLLDGTDPKLVAFEMDLFWIIKGGGNPLDYFHRYPGRFPMVHVKDMTADGSMVDVGDGQIDFAGIFSHHRQAGITHYFVEHDTPASPLESARKSYNSLRRLEF